MARGTNTLGDVLQSTIDGVDLNVVFADMARTLDIVNTARDDLRSMLSFSTTAAGDEIAQTADLDNFEDSSEFGQPVGIRGPGDVLALGFNLKFRDKAARYTRAYLIDATRAQIDAVHDRVLEADNRQVFQAVAGALLNPTSRLNAERLVIQPLYNGDGTVAPDWNGQSFPGTHSHYIASGSATFDGGDVRDAYKLVAEHGHGDPTVGGRVLVFLNPNEAEAARGFKKGAATTDPYDFIPSVNTSAFLSAEQIIGERAPSSLGRIPIIGSYGPAWISQSSLIPAGYVVAVASYGPNDQRNVVAFREHTRPEYRGLLQIPGQNPDYPLQDSFYSRGFGTGIRQRGGAGVIQIKAAGSYDVPAAYSTVVA